MDINQLKTALSCPEGWFIFAGEEEYLKRYYLDKLYESLIPDAFTAPFNYIAFDGPEIDFGKLLDAIKAPPMMSEKKLVVWKYADFEKMREGARAALDELVGTRKEYPYTVLVFLVSADGFELGTLPKRPSKLYTRYHKDFHIVNFPRSTEGQLLSWLKRHFDAEGVAVDINALRALLFRCGHAMDVLKKEVEKLAAYAKANGLPAITPAEVELVASATPECDTFALSSAISERNHMLAYRALSELKLERTDPTMILGMIAKSYTELLSVSRLLDEGRGSTDIAELLKMNPYKVKLSIPAAKRYGTARLTEAVKQLSRADEQSKMGNIDGYAVIEMLLAKTM